MKVVEVRYVGDFGGLQQVERTIPDPPRGAALVRIRAASLNYRDLLIPQDRFPVPLNFIGRIPLSDGAGEVVALGPDVDRIKVGDRVVVTPLPRWIGGEIQPGHGDDNYGFNIDGMAAEYRVIDAEALVHLPEYLSYQEAATLPCAGVSAWNCLMDGRRPLRAGDTVLIQGTGGLSLLALQFAKAAGARVIATTSSPQKAERLRELGADEVVNYREHVNWDEEVLSLTGGIGVDRVVEVGGGGTLARSVATSRVGGHISSVGFVSGEAGGLEMTPLLLTKALSVSFMMMGSRGHFEALLRAMAQARIKPVIDSVFALADISGAYARLESGKHTGKVVVNLD